MAAFQDDDRGVVFPTRFGTPSGNANERVMLEEVDGAGGIRTRLRAHVDGSVTMLRTHDGMPRFVRAGMMATGQSNPRGFAAWVQGGNVGVRFDPYDLEVLTPEYRPVDVTYTVLPFASPYNVPSDDTTKWHDVVTFSGSTVLVNAIPMPILQMGTFAPGNGIPWVRRVHAAVGLANYGEQNMNLTEKRVFSVGREEVRASDATATLTPTSPRAEDKAMTIGQRIEASTSRAFLGQLFFSGSSWDDIGGEWGFSSAEVAMMLTPPYLSKVSTGMVAAMPIVSFGDPVSSSGSMDTSTTLPATPVAMTATGNIESISTYYAGGVGGTGGATIHWYWDGTVSKELEGYVHAGYYRLSYTGDDTHSATQGGYSVVYYGNNVKNFDVRSDVTYISAQTVPLVDTHTDSLTGASLGATATTLYWDTNTSYNTPETVPPTRGKTERLVFGGAAGFGPSATRDYETQTGTFTVTSNSVEILYCEYYREHSTGQKEVFSPDTTYYDRYIGNYTYSGDGMGMFGRIFLEPKVWPGTDTIEIADYYKINPYPPPIQSPEAVAEINQEYADMASALAAQIYYDNESAYFPHNFYSRTIANDITQDTRSLTWRTKDYLLHDVTNGVYISVEGSFSGSGHPATATLAVSLKVQTRYHTNSISLGGWNYTYGELLPEKILDEDLNLWAVPSPQIRAIFAPLYQEQGSFKGAHYVTAAEEANGALPFHGFNFVLRLQMYDSIGTINAENASQHEIHMVPCNLLEMLYAFVFSQEYGVSQYERYPVHYVARFKALQESLFSSTVRVHIRDGTVHDWLDALGHPYIDDTTTELYRT